MEISRETIEIFIKEWVSCVRLSGLYGREHKLATEALNNGYGLLEKILLVEGKITIAVIGNEIVFKEKPFYEMSRQLRGFVRHLKQLKAEKITFSSGVTKKELADFVVLLALKDKQFDKTKDISVLLSSGHINVRKLDLEKEEEFQRNEENIRALLRKNYQQALDFLERISEDIKGRRAIDVNFARQLVGNMITDVLKNRDLLLVLASLKNHSEGTFVHDVNVAIFTIMQAESLGIPQELLNDIGVAALLHDVGKISVSEDILEKKGTLSVDERHEIAKHPCDGAKILLESPEINPLAAIVAFEHHILYDNSGYPKKLNEDKTNVVSMMTAIADYYDALRSKRAYRDEVDPEVTYEEMMKLSGKNFHPDLLNNFFRIIGVYPSGTLVELNTKEIGIVVRQNEMNIKRPQVEILYDDKGEKEEKVYIADLLEKNETGQYRRTIVRSIRPSAEVKVPEKYV